MESWMGDMLRLTALAAFVLANAFFVAAEFALVSVRRSRVEELVAAGHARARVVQGAMRDLDRYIAGTQIGITMASLALGWIGEPALAHLIEPMLGWMPASAAVVTSHGIAVGVAFVLITFLHVVFGELVPKSVALQRTEPTALWVAEPMKFFVGLFQPLIWALNGLGNLVLRLIGLEPAGELHFVHSADELRILVRQSRKAGVLDELGSRLAERAFRFPDLTARDVMVPRPDMIALNAALPAETLLDIVTRSDRSRLPVYDGRLDNIIGTLHQKDVLRHLRQSKEPFDVRKLVRAPVFVPETIRLDDLFRNFQRNRTEIAIVTDEHGGVAGLATLRDVVKEVFGEMTATQQRPLPAILPQPDGRVLARGDVRLRELNEWLGWRLEDEQADTIAGYVMKHLGRVAQVGDTIDTSHGVIRVESVSRLRIVQVVITPKPR
ncbi:MAG: HlyC/CorC family transporter [Verrucomicrobia bacterium]|nr:HlyC/CorC family transporter [Verrucomicrobiota bacterium]